MSLRQLKTAILIGVFLLPTLFLLFTLVQQRWITWEMHERLEKSQLITLTMPTSSIQWVKEGKEIVIQGRLFDVKSISYAYEFAHINGLFDEEETNLVNRINGQLHQQNTGKQLRLSLLCSILLGLSTEQNKGTEKNQVVANFDFSLPRHTLYLSPLLEQVSPPPQC